MSRWIIINFIQDNSIEAVPDSWAFKGRCAWPKNSKMVKKSIEKRIKPNKSDFFFLPARKLGNQSYSSLSQARLKLQKATLKSDLESTEDDDGCLNKKLQTRKVKSLTKLTEDAEVVPREISTSCPRFKDYISELSESNHSSNNNPNKSTDDNLLLDDLLLDDLMLECNDNEYDSDKDPPWTMKCGNNGVFQQTKPNKDILLTSPYSSSKLSQFETDYSKNNHEIKHINDDQTTNQQQLNSPSGTWSVEKVMAEDHYDSPKINELSIAKKSLFKEKTAAEEILDLKSYLIKTLTQIRYRIDGIETVVQTNNLNIEKLIDLRNNFEPSSILAEQQDFDMDKIFPIKNEEDLKEFESLILNKDYRSVLVCKLSLLITNNIGNSIRRICSRMFHDELLSNYSLLGFKKKKPFSKLLSYRLLIDIIRSNSKYKLTLEKEIDVPISVWLSHARFRLKK